MGRFLFYSYIFLIVSSLLLIGHIVIQKIVDILWIFLAITCIVRSIKKRPTSFIKVSLGSILAQLPGIFMAFLCFYSFKTGFYGWADGVLEIWIHPFLPYLELLPPKHVGRVSGVFINSCLLPFEIVLFFVLMGGIMIFYERNFALNVLNRKQK